MLSKAQQDLSTSLRPPESPSVTVPPRLCSCHTSRCLENAKLMSTSCLLGLLPFPPDTGLQASDGQDGSTDRPVLQRHLHSPNPICSSRETVDPVLIRFTTWLGLFTYLVAVCPLMPQWTLHKVGTFSILSIALLLAPRKILGIHKLVFIESMHDSPQIVCLAVYVHVYSSSPCPPCGKSLGFIRPKERFRLSWLFSG